MTQNHKYGISFSQKLPSLHKDSWFEPPIVVQATFSENNLIQIGAFTGIYGGKIGHSVIGRYCSIAPGVDIASDQHPTNWLSSSMIQYLPDVHGWGSWLESNNQPYILPVHKFESNKIVNIGNDVWIGQGVFIKSGVNIGDGSIIAAHSVVISDVPPYAIFAGVPAKLKKFRFSEEIISDLIKVKWWNYNISSIPNINFSNVKESIEAIKKCISSGTISPYTPKKYSAEELC